MKQKKTLHKIREERSGAMLFNVEKGEIKALNEQEYKDKSKELLNAKVYKQKNRSKLPTDCYAAPSKVYIELTRKCNLRCSICYNKSGPQLKDELSKNELFNLFDQLEKAGTFEIRFTGGEPTTRPDFFELVNYAKSKGFFVSVGTNGVWDDTILKKISSSGLDMVIISLEGRQKINDQIRGKGNYKKAIKSISYLSKYSTKMMRMNMTLAKYNIKEIDHIAKLADKYGVPVINTMPIRLSGRSVSLRNQLLNTFDYWMFVKDVERIRKTRKVSIQTYFDILGDKSRWLENQTSLINKKTCAAGVEACIISPIGDVYGCAASNASDPDMDPNEKNKFIAGNIKKKKFMKIWLDSQQWKTYRDLDINKCARCKSCEHYSKKCFGNCFISSYFDTGKFNSRDPYCFAHLLDYQK